MNILKCKHDTFVFLFLLITTYFFDVQNAKVYTFQKYKAFIIKLEYGSVILFASFAIDISRDTHKIFKSDFAAEDV